MLFALDVGFFSETIIQIHLSFISLNISIKNFQNFLLNKVKSAHDVIGLQIVDSQWLNEGFSGVALNADCGTTLISSNSKFQFC